MLNVNEILRDHVTLTVECMDRLYLNGYIPNMQMPGQLVNLLTKHWGNKIPGVDPVKWIVVGLGKGAKNTQNPSTLSGGISPANPATDTSGSDA